MPNFFDQFDPKVTPPFVTLPSGKQMPVSDVTGTEALAPGTAGSPALLSKPGAEAALGFSTEPGGAARLAPGVGPTEPPSMTMQAQAQDPQTWETKHYNFGGLRKPGITAGPNAGGFQEFASPLEGVQAIGRQLDRYQSGAFGGVPITTLKDMVTTWAPPNENDTAALIKRAAEVTGLDPNKPVDMSDPAIKAKVIEAFIRNEQGGKLPVDPSVIAEAVKGSNFFDQFSPAGGSGGAGGRAASGAPPFRVSPTAISEEQGKPDTRVVWMAPDDYKQMVQKGADTEDRGPSKSLNKSLDKGELINSLPEMTVKLKNGQLVVEDQDGWRRADAASKAGLDMIPVAIHGASGDAKTIKSVNGTEYPFDFKTVAPPPKPDSALDRFGTGLKDIALGLAQIGARGVTDPPAIAYTEQQAQAVAPERQQEAAAGVDQGVAEREKRIEAERAAAGQTGTDWMRLAGNVVGTAPLMALGPEVGGELRGAMMAGAIGGAGGAALAPVTQGDYGTQKAEQIGLGALLGGGLGAGGNALARLLKPYIDPAAQRLMDMGVDKLLPGMLKGPGMRRTIEQQSTSVPFSGAAVAAAQRRAVESFNKAIYNKVLGHIGAHLPTDIKAGPEAVAAVEKRLSAAYDALKPYIQFHVDADFKADLAAIKADLAGMPKTVRDSFENVWKSRVVPLLRQGGGALDGKTFKLLESQLGSDARDWTAFQNSPFEKRVGYAIKDLQGALREGMERTTPNHKGELKALNTAWAAFMRIQDASTRRPTSLGIFTPGDLLASEKKLAGKSVFARGDGLLQQPASDAQHIIGNTYPDSGTAGRGATMAQVAELVGVLGGAVLHPGALVATLGTQAGQAAGYGTSAGVKFLRGMAGTGMPALRNALATIAQRAPVAAAPSSAITATAPPSFAPPAQAPRF